MSAAEHAELVERINQLNLLRESNATLRAENKSTKALVKDLQAQLGAARTQLEPLQQQLRVLQAELETKDARIVQLTKEVSHWQERNKQILSKVSKVTLRLIIPHD
jgi:nucleoprotein TPR